MLNQLMNEQAPLEASKGENRNERGFDASQAMKQIQYLYEQIVFS